MKRTSGNGWLLEVSGKGGDPDCSARARVHKDTYFDSKTVATSTRSTHRRRATKASNPTHKVPFECVHHPSATINCSVRAVDLAQVLPSRVPRPSRTSRQTSAQNTSWIRRGFPGVPIPTAGAGAWKIGTTTGRTHAPRCAVIPESIDPGPSCIGSKGRDRRTPVSCLRQRTTCILVQSP